MVGQRLFLYTISNLAIINCGYDVMGSWGLLEDRTLDG